MACSAVQAVGDVVFEGEARSSAPWVMSSRLTARAKALSFIFLSTPLASTSCDGLCGLDEGAGGEEAGELVAGEEGLSRWVVGRDAGVVGVGEDGVEDFFGPAVIAEVGDADEGVLGGGGVALVVEVVEEAGAEVGVGEAGGCVGLAGEATRGRACGGFRRVHSLRRACGLQRASGGRAWIEDTMLSLAQAERSTAVADASRLTTLR